MCSNLSNYPPKIDCSVFVPVYINLMVTTTKSLQQIHEKERERSPNNIEKEKREVKRGRGKEERMRQEGRQRTITREETKKRRNREKLPKQPENNNMAIIIICSIITFTGSDEIHQSKPRGWPNRLKKKKRPELLW